MSDFKIGPPRFRAAAKTGKAAARGRAEEAAALPREARRYDTVEISPRALSGVSPLPPKREPDLAALMEGAAEKLDALITEAYGGDPLPEEGKHPVRGREETEDAWQRRRLTRAMDEAWTGSLRQWLEEDGELSPEEAQERLNERSRQWVTALMRDHPAQFRLWLERDRFLLEAGLGDRCVLPRGLSGEECLEWLSHDAPESG